MIERRAPLWVEAHDLACALATALAGRDEPHRVLADAVRHTSHELLAHVAVALTFPQERLQSTRAADLALTRLRQLLRLARDVDLLRPQRYRAAHAAAERAGRMLGGWRRSLGATEERTNPRHSGDGPWRL